MQRLSIEQRLQLAQMLYDRARQELQEHTNQFTAARTRRAQSLLYNASVLIRAIVSRRTRWAREATDEQRRRAEQLLHDIEQLYPRPK